MAGNLGWVPPLEHPEYHGIRDKQVNSYQEEVELVEFQNHMLNLPTSSSYNKGRKGNCSTGTSFSWSTVWRGCWALRFENQGSGSGCNWTGQVTEPNEPVRSWDAWLNAGRTDFYDRSGWCWGRRINKWRPRRILGLEWEMLGGSSTQLLSMSLAQLDAKSQVNLIWLELLPTGRLCQLIHLYHCHC